MRGSEVQQWEPQGGALVPTQTFPVEVSGPFFSFQGEWWHHAGGFPPRLCQQGRTELAPWVSLVSLGAFTCLAMAHALAYPS